jgi:LysR family transcriptional regulator, regulator for bpeEF and oprC
MRLSDRLQGIEEFLAVAELGSFVAAANQLALTPSGVGKAVQRLEQRLGVRLFTRTTRRVALTEDGSLFRERCQSVVAELSDAESEIDRRSTAMSGLVRLNAPIAYGRIKLLAAIAKFKQLHPAIQFDLRFTDQLIDPIKERVDLVVRIGQLEDSSMWARRIDNIRFGVYGSPSYLHEQGVPQNLEDLKAHRRLAFAMNTGRLLAFKLQSDGVPVVTPVDEALVSDDLEALIGLAIEGAGLLYAPTFIVQHAVNAKTLVPVLTDFWIDGPPVHLLYPQPKLMPKRVRAFADALLIEFNSDMAEGRLNLRR